MSGERSLRALVVLALATLCTVKGDGKIGGSTRHAVVRSVSPMRIASIAAGGRIGVEDEKRQESILHGGSKALVHPANAQEWFFDEGGDGQLQDLTAQELEHMYTDFQSRVWNSRSILQRDSASMPVPLDGHPRHIENRKPVIHHHVHHNAGTYMCAMAHRNLERATDHKKGNCNMIYVPLHEDGPWYRPSHQNYTCADREKQTSERNLTFAMIEREIDFESGDWCPDRFLYTIILRDPIARGFTTLRSNEKNNADKVKAYFEEARSGQPLQRQWLHSFVAYSDLMVRHLNGPDVMKLPLGALNHSHLKLAKQRLHEFDAVLAVPTLYSDHVQLVSLLGWDPTLPMKGSAGKPPPDVPWLDDLLQENNKWDKQLYEYGLRLARNRSNALLRQCKFPGFCNPGAGKV